MSRMIPLSKLKAIPQMEALNARLDADPEHREQRALDKALLIADVKEQGIRTPLHVTNPDDDGKRWILAGLDRGEAGRINGHSAVPCDVRSDITTEAQRLAYARADNYYRKSIPVKLRIEEVLAEDEPKPEDQRRSDRAVAKICACSPNTVGYVRKELVSAGKVSPSAPENRVNKRGTRQGMRPTAGKKTTPKPPTPEVSSEDTSPEVPVERSFGLPDKTIDGPVPKRPTPEFVANAKNTFGYIEAIITGFSQLDILMRTLARKNNLAKLMPADIDRLTPAFNQFVDSMNKFSAVIGRGSPKENA